MSATASAHTTNQPANAPKPDRAETRLWSLSAVTCVLLCAWVIWKWGGFDLTTVVQVNGSSVRVPNTYASVDNPFHAARAEMLLQSLREGHLLRWISVHQGGYPVEFYPLGVAGFDVALWVLTFGAFPIVAIHKLAVLIVFVLPVVGFWLLARGDRQNMFVPVLALVIHVSLPGQWTGGGLTELVEWGLVANVGGASLAFIGFAALSRYVNEGKGYQACIAILSISGAMYANSRSSIPIAVAGLGLLVYCAVGYLPWLTSPRPSIRTVIGRLALVAGVSGLLSAPLLAAMVRYRDLYYFVNYNEYLNASAYLQTTYDTLNRPIVWMAIVGCAVALAVSRLVNLRASMIVGVLYCLLTLALSGNSLDEGLIQQLESPRLMPFQRLLMVYLAAAAIAWAIEYLSGFVSRWRLAISSTAIVLAAVWVHTLFPGTYGVVPAPLVTTTVPTVGVPEFGQYEAAVTQANALVQPGQAIYVVGDQESWWHEQLWGTTFSDAPFYYDDWMWYWQPEVIDPVCNANGGHFEPRPASTFTPEWLASKGIGVLVVTNMTVGTCGTEDPRHAAENNPALQYDSTFGYWDVYRVVDAGSVVTNGSSQPTATSVENGAIDAMFKDASGVITVRQNWFPRWEAWADGKRVDVRQTADGLMEIDVPDGTHAVSLRYTVTTLDWASRIAALLGGAIAVACVVPGLSGRVQNRLVRRPAEPVAAR